MNCKKSIKRYSLLALLLTAPLTFTNTYQPTVVITEESAITPEDLIAHIVEDCISNHHPRTPFAVFIEQIKQVIINHLSYFNDKYSELTIKNLLADLGKLKKAKNVPQIQKILEKYTHINGLSVKRNKKELFFGLIARLQVKG